MRFGPDSDPLELGEELGSGAAARVYTCRRLGTGERLAAKVINLQKLRLLDDFEAQMAKLDREVDVLRELRHPRIVNMHNVYHTRNWIFIVMELVRGGELFDQIVKNQTLSEAEARHIFRQLLEAVGYMHQKRVIHRDLKPENILIASTCAAGAPAGCQLHEIKVADFGLSKFISEGTSFAKTFVGTPQYWAPEVINVQRYGGSYTRAADFWSLGAVLFVMLSGRFPFTGKRMALEDEICAAAFRIDTPVWQKISDEAKDMVRGLLSVSPSKRFGLEECLSHPWLAAGGAPARPEPVVTEVASVSGSSATVSVQQQPEIDEGLAVPSPRHKEQQPFEQHTIFCLGELLKLQVSIAGSLEMACLAFRHADPELSDAIRMTFRQARDLSSQSAKVVSQYAQVAQQVSQYVLPDLKLAVEEREPSLAVNLLGMVKEWVVTMKSDGMGMQRQYMGLQDSVHSLIQRAQHAKLTADRRLAEAVQEVDAEGAQPQMLALGGSRLPDCAPSAGSTPAAAEGNAASGGAVANGGAPATAVDVPLSMSRWTQQLFEQFSHVRDGRGAGDSGGADVPGAAGDGAGHRDILELLFMAPGVAPSHLPQVEQLIGTPCLKPVAETVTHSSASLLRALRELKRVDEILHGCSLFWTNMDSTVQKLAHLKEHTQCLLNYMSKSKPLRERFEQRLAEYTNFWASLRVLCQQYCVDHQAAATKMYDAIREVNDAADMADTAHSAQMGLVLAMREKQRRDGFAVQV